MKLSLENLKNVVGDYVDAAKQAGAWNPTTDNIAGLLDKIGKTFQIDGLFSDKLPEFDGEELPYGKTIEEWYQDLVAPVDFDSTGSNALAPNDPTYRPVAYSYTLGRKVIPTTIRYNEYERACTSSGEVSELVNTITKRLYDSLALFKYGSKKQLIANAIDKCQTAMNTSTAYTPANAASYSVGEFYKNGTQVGVVVIGLAAGSSWDNNVSEGKIVVIDLVKQVAKPVDTATGEAFLQQVKADIEEAQFASEGHSLNGNTVGAEQGLMLIMLKGIKPVLDVQVEAGAFNPDKLAVPAVMKVVEDFGDDATGAYAVLIDPRGLRLHNTYQAIRTQENGKGDFINYFLHTENTAFISRNTFIKIYKA